MRCALATTAPIYGGVWRHILDLAVGLREIGIDVEVLGPEPLIPELRDRNSTLHFGVLDDEIRADIFHFHLADTYERHHGRFIRKIAFTNVPVVVTEHLPRTLASDPTIVLPNVQRKPGSTQWKTVYKRWALSQVQAVISVSPEDREFLVRRYGFPPSKVWAAPLEIDVLDEQTAVSSPSRFLAAGSIITQKGFDVLVEATAHRETDWTVDVFGEGPHRDRLQRRSDELGSFVNFRGFTSNVFHEMKMSRGVIIPSRWESGPYVLLEAMANARPAVVSSVDAMPRIVTTAECGVVFESGNPKSLAKAIDDLVLSRDISRIGNNGYTFAKSMSIKHMASRNAEIYGKVLEK